MIKEPLGLSVAIPTRSYPAQSDRGKARWAGAWGRARARRASTPDAARACTLLLLLVPLKHRAGDQAIIVLRPGHTTKSPSLACIIARTRIISIIALQAQ